MSNFLFFQGIAKPAKTRSERAALVTQGSDRERTVCEESREFFRLMFEAVKLPPDTYRHQYLQRRVPACLRILGARDLAAGLQKIKEQPDVAARMVGAVLLGVTEFYRDEPVFQHLQEQVLPKWQGAAERLRIWSAACSEGQEVYSVALLLAECGLLDKAELLGTDYRQEAIIKARAGRFCAEGAGRLDRGITRCYVTSGKSELWMDETLRKAICWKQADLFAGVEAGPWHLILWRNMAIYLERPAADELWRKLVAELKPGGYLITGKADYPSAGLGLVRIANCIYQKKDTH